MSMHVFECEHINVCLGVRVCLNVGMCVIGCERVRECV